MSRYCRLRWEHPERDDYHEVILDRDLFGDWYLQQIWGHRRQSVGHCVQRIVDNFSAGQTILLQFAHDRKAEGSVLTLKQGDYYWPIKA